MIVDDHPSMCEGVRSLLAMTGIPHEVVGQHGTFARALEALARERPTLVIADYSMPDMSFDVFLRDAREIAHDVPVLCLSASVSSEDALTVLRGGGAGFVTKAADVQELAHAVNAVMRGDVWISAGALESLLRKARKQA